MVGWLRKKPSDFLRNSCGTPRSFRFVGLRGAFWRSEIAKIKIQNYAFSGHASTAGENGRRKNLPPVWIPIPSGSGSERGEPPALAGEGSERRTAPRNAREYKRARQDRRTRSGCKNSGPRGELQSSASGAAPSVSFSAFRRRDPRRPSSRSTGPAFELFGAVAGLFCIILIEIRSQKTIGADHFVRRTWRSDRELRAILWAVFWKRRAFPRLLAPFRRSSVGVFAEFRKTGSCAAIFRPKTRGKRKKRPSYLVETDMTTFSHTSHFHATP